MKLKELRIYGNEVKDGYGLEIEVEGINLPNIKSVYWEVHNDGSLRGEAFEYVTKGALLLEELPKALKTLNNSFAKKESELHLSFRTSVHVHMNVREVDVNKIGAIIYIYYMYEELFMQFCGEDRIGNRFCLRMRDSEEVVSNVIQAFKTKFKMLDANLLKYSALNIAPIRTFGSLEFRGMRGTVDTDTIVTWVNLLNCLKVAPFNSAKEVYEFLEREGIERLSELVFGDWFRFIQFEGWKQEVVRNASIAIDLPHRIPNINQPERKEQVEEAVRKMEMFFNAPRPALMPGQGFVEPIPEYPEEEEY